MNFGDGESQIGRVLARLPEPGRVLLPDIPARLMLKPIVGPGQYGPAFVPNDLLVMQKADAQQAIENFPRELRGMPHIRHLETRHQRECFRPICTSVGRDGGFGVTLGSALHVAGLSRATAIQSSPVAPFRVELNSVGRIGHHQERFALTQKPRPRLQGSLHRHKAPDAECGVSPHSHTSPSCDTACSGTGGTTSALSQSGPARRSSSSLTSKPVRAEIELRVLQFQQLQGERLFVPTCAECQSVVRDDICALLRFA